MTPFNHPGKFIPGAPRVRATTPQPTALPSSAGAPPGRGATAGPRANAPPRPAEPVPAGIRWTPNAAPVAAPRPSPRSSPVAVPRPPRSLASIELFQKAQALLLALPAQPPVLRREGVELLAALGAGYLNGDAASLLPALNETRARCGRLLALLTALCPAQLGEFEMQLHGLHRACGFFIRYLQEQNRAGKG